MSAAPRDPATAVSGAAAELRAQLRPILRDFNSRRYWEAHEALEDVLDSVPDDEWSLFLGLIQVTAAYHRMTKGLWNGAARMLGLALEQLEPYPPDAAGLDLEALRDRLRRDLAALRAGTFEAEDFVRTPPRASLLKRAVAKADPRR